MQKWPSRVSHTEALKSLCDAFEVKDVPVPGFVSGKNSCKVAAGWEPSHAMIQGLGGTPWQTQAYTGQRKMSKMA